MSQSCLLRRHCQSDDNHVLKSCLTRQRRGLTRQSHRPGTDFVDSGRQGCSGEKNHGNNAVRGCGFQVALAVASIGDRLAPTLAASTPRVVVVELLTSRMEVVLLLHGTWGEAKGTLCNRHIGYGPVDVQCVVCRYFYFGIFWSRPLRHIGPSTAMYLDRGRLVSAGRSHC